MTISISELEKREEIHFLETLLIKEKANRDNSNTRLHDLLVKLKTLNPAQDYSDA